MLSEKREGGCLCGRIRYRINGAPVATVACHCSHCQTQTGAAFGLTMVIKRSDFEVLSGEPRAFTFNADSGALKTGRFCGDCGTRIWNENERLPDTYNLKPGTRDDRSWFTPVAHVWLSSKQPWVVIPDDMPTFEKNPTKPG